VLEPGAWGCVFGSPRLYHRMMINAEDAGFRLRDTICWLYGSGFPKSKNLGHLGTALKPAWEPIALIQKPQARVTRYLDIRAGRIATDFAERSEAWKRSGHSAKPGADKIAAPPGRGINLDAAGRWPANLVLDEEAGALLGSEARFFYWPILGTGELVGRPEGQEGLSNPRAGAGRGGNRRNPHPTIKPKALTGWLARMLRGNATKPLLVPYAGVGSEILGAIPTWNRVVGIERDLRYCQIARDRIRNETSTCSVYAKENGETTTWKRCNPYRG
jgi:DNA modification methylase